VVAPSAKSPRLVVVTGAAGFIGARVSELLLAGGDTVVGIDSLNDAYDVRLKSWRLARLSSCDRFHFIGTDVSDRAALDRAWDSLPSPAAAVVNLAARAGIRASVRDPWSFVDANVTGTVNLLEVCRRRSVPKFVLASSSSLYGCSKVTPYREDAPTDHPISPYAASKKAAELLCHSYHHLHGLDVSVLRYFTVYGPAGRPDMSPFRFVQWIAEGRPVRVTGDGTQRRDFTFVDDIAEGTVAAIKPLGYEIVNLGSDRPIALLDLVALVEGLVGRSAEIEFLPAEASDVPETWADVTKACRMLGWRAKTPLEVGLERLTDWYQENRAWARDIATG
jgi:UDP-glucuronate 4-epimerase